MNEQTKRPNLLDRRRMFVRKERHTEKTAAKAAFGWFCYFAIQVALFSLNKAGILSKISLICLCIVTAQVALSFAYLVIGVPILGRAVGAVAGGFIGGIAEHFWSGIKIGSVLVPIVVLTVFMRQLHEEKTRSISYPLLFLLSFVLTPLHILLRIVDAILLASSTQKQTQTPSTS